MRSSSIWIQRQKYDVYTKLAAVNSYRSRAAYKLCDIQKKFKILNKVSSVLDLGSYPGSWLQYIRRTVSSECRVFGIDLQKVAHLKGTEVLQGDFTNDSMQEKIRALNNTFDLICSDMSPKSIGNRFVDHMNIIHLANSVVEFSCKHQKLHGKLIVKIFQGCHVKSLVQRLETKFLKVKIFKPQSSYKDSRELFLVAQGCFKKKES